MRNQLKQLTKINCKGKAITSLMIGIISIIAASITWGPPLLKDIFLGTWKEAKIYYSIFILFSFLGIILGISGLKSSKKIFAISGIILSGIGFILLGYVFFVYLILTKMGGLR